MHRLFIDQNVRIEIAQVLREARNVVFHACEAGLQRHPDEVIFRWALHWRLAIVTFDADFAQRTYWGREPHYGILRLKMEPETPEHVLPVLFRFLTAYPHERWKNALVDLSERRLRILPAAWWV